MAARRTTSRGGMLPAQGANQVPGAGGKGMGLVQAELEAPFLCPEPLALNRAQLFVERSDRLFEHLPVGRSGGALEIGGRAGARELDRLAFRVALALAGGELRFWRPRACRFLLVELDHLRFEAACHTPPIIKIACHV